MSSRRRMKPKLAGLAILASVLVGCAPSSEETLTATGFHNVGTTAESTIWVAGKPNVDGDYEVKVTGKLNGYCNGSVLAAVGTQICNMGETDRDSIFIIGAPDVATGGSLTLTDETIVSLAAFDIPGRSDLKIVVGIAPSNTGASFIDVQFTTASGEILNRQGNPMVDAESLVGGPSQASLGAP
ncbi:hypothetical protein [Arthrobacter antibioticus]|nr:hypothetical protein [Arthrobacter sp. H35-MC1]MDJ0318639.1 hypothetical protein [Arthrobacter sp. H35-MC1]